MLRRATAKRLRWKSGLATVFGWRSGLPLNLRLKTEVCAIILYQSEGCPYCAKVREKLSELGISYVIHNPRLPGDEGGDVTNEVTHEELTAGGEDQTPYLVDTERGVTMYESDDIVQYLEQHYE